MRPWLLLVVVVSCNQSHQAAQVPSAAPRGDLDAAMPGARRRFVLDHAARGASVELFARPGGLPVVGDDPVWPLVLGTPTGGDDRDVAYADGPDGARHTWPPLDVAAFTAILDALDRVQPLEQALRRHTYYANGGAPPPADSEEGLDLCRPPHLEIRVTVHDDSWYHYFIVEVPWRTGAADRWIRSLHEAHLPDGADVWLDQVAAEMATPRPPSDRAPCKPQRARITPETDAGPAQLEIR